MPITMRQKKSSWASTDCTNLSIYQWTINQAVAKGYPINNPEDVAYSRTMYIGSIDVMGIGVTLVDNASDV